MNPKAQLIIGNTVATASNTEAETTNALLQRADLAELCSMLGYQCVPKPQLMIGRHMSNEL